MKERPIIFSGEMVRAILNGRKTQTRRVIKPQPISIGPEKAKFTIDGCSYWDGGEAFIRCPYGKPSDQLWVKETHVFERYEDEPVNNRPIFYHKGDDTEYDEPYWLCPHYRATDPAPELDYSELDGDDGEPKCKWLSSRFMPKWASRIKLEIINVRVERLQEISESDAEAEGIHLLGLPEKERYNHPRKHIVAFKELWNLLNAMRSFGWEHNPWVWVIEFKRILP
jgi:hypothetical protein